MSKYIASIPLADIDRISILMGGKQTMEQVKGDADYILNGGFYDMRTGKPVGHLKAGGKVLAAEGWNCWGMTWDAGGDIRMDVVPDMGGANYISGLELLTRDLGPKGKISYPADQGGKRGRSAMGLAGDRLVLYCSGDGTPDACNPAKLRDELVELGCDRAIMLDSGGSSQCDFAGKRISSSRRVHNYIAVWLKKTGTEPGKGETPMRKKVMLDPGHGIETAGKRSPDGTYLEHEFNLDMAQRLKAQLERHGVSVILTRNTEHDVSLADRVAISNAANPDLFVSLHSNASGDGTAWTSPDGYGIYTSAAEETAERNKAAKAILARAREAGVSLWGEGLHHDISLYVLKNTVAPAVLIEHGFHTNRVETEKLKSAAYRDLLAAVDAKGILDYLGMDWVEEPGEDDPIEYEPWYQQARRWAMEKGITDGAQPEKACTRAEVWQMLYRLKGE